MISETADLKPEIQIITLLNDLWALWEKFLTKHSEGELIDPYFYTMYKDVKGFKLKNLSLKREFFKYFGHFTDKNYGVNAQHLIDETPGRKATYPKVSVTVPKFIVPDNMTHKEWVDWRKHKKIVLQELMALKLALRFFDSASNAVDKTWQSWKTRHRFTSASWDFLLTHPKADYFKHRLRNNTWLKRTKDLDKQFLEILFMFTKFMKLKYQLPDPAGGVEIRGIDASARALVSSPTYRYQHREVNLAVLNVREIPRAKEGGSTMEPFLHFFKKRLEPNMSASNVWLFILSGRDDVKHATSFVDAHLDQYEFTLSRYVPSKAELLNGISTRSTALDMPLLFLFKKENSFAQSARPLLKGRYNTPLGNSYYYDYDKNTESKWRAGPYELRMEFYLDIMQAFAKSEENVLGIYVGAKFMLAAKV